MKKFLVRIFIIIGVSTLITSCKDNFTCVTCDDGSGYISSYIPYKDGDTTLIKFVNEFDDTLKSNVYIHENETIEGIIGEYTCSAWKEMNIFGNKVNEVLINANAVVRIHVAQTTEMVIWKRQNGQYDFYNTFWTSSVDEMTPRSVDAMFDKKDVDFRNGEEINYRVEAFATDNSTPIWCSRYVLERDKGLIEFDDVINNCTWRLVE